MELQKKSLGCLLYSPRTFFSRNADEGKEQTQLQLCFLACVSLNVKRKGTVRNFRHHLEVFETKFFAKFHYNRCPSTVIHLVCSVCKRTECVVGNNGLREAIRTGHQESRVDLAQGFQFVSWIQI